MQFHQECSSRARQHLFPSFQSLSQHPDSMSTPLLAQVVTSCFFSGCSWQLGATTRAREGTALTIHHLFLMERERPFPPSHTDGMIFPACFLFSESFAPVCRKNTATAMGAENPWSELNQQEEKGLLISTGLREVTMDRLRTSGRAKVTIPFG